MACSDAFSPATRQCLSRRDIGPYTPSNITLASSPLPVFMKKAFSLPSSSFETILDVDAELQPPPPAEETLVVAGSRPRSFRTAGSSFIMDCVVSCLHSTSSITERSYCRARRAAMTSHYSRTSNRPPTVRVSTNLELPVSVTKSLYLASYTSHRHA